MVYNYDENHSSTNRSRGQVTSVWNSGVNPKRLYYNSQGLLAQEVVSIVGAPQSYTTLYGYDSYLRPTTTTYPDNEVVTVNYNGMGLPNTLYSSWWGSNPIIDSVSYDEANRLRQLRLPQGNTSTGDDRWRVYVYQPWNSTNSYSPHGWTMSSNDRNGRLQYVAIGTYAGGGDLYGIEYQYDSFGNIKRAGDWDTLTSSDHTFTYDVQNRLTDGYGRAYTYDSAGRLTGYEGTAMTAGGLKPHLSLPNTNYSFDANGNMTSPYGYTLEWDHENHLSRVKSGNIEIESYLYDADGQRVRKTSGGVTTYYPNQFYEVSGSTITKLHCKCLAYYNRFGTATGANRYTVTVCKVLTLLF